MPDLDFTGLNAAAQAAFKPHFAEVQRRAGRRRRRTRMIGVLSAVAVVATGSGVAVGAVRSHERPPAVAPGFGADRTPDFIPAPGATVTPGPGRRVSTGRPTAGDLDHLYLRYHDCRDEVCQLRYAATEDRGRTWRTGKLPVPDNAMVVLHAVAPRTLVAWYVNRADPNSRSARWIASTDGGATWREVTPHSVAALPTGWLVLGRDPGPDTEPLLAADPATGDIAQLATLSKLENAAYAEGVPATAGLWVSGSTGHRVGAGGRVTYTGSAVEVSRDGGRSWQRHVFPEAVTASDDGFGAASVASHDGRTVYAVGRIGGKLVIWRSGDSGRSWQRAVGTAEVGTRTVRATVRPDGTLVIQAGLSAGEDPLMVASTDGGRILRLTTLGPGAVALPVPGGYVQTGWPDAKGAWLSTDGLTWSWVDPPDLP